jgi:MFS family permease
MSVAMQLLTSRRFLPLFVTQFLGAFNDNAFKNALLIWIAYESAPRSGEFTAILINLAAGVFILPFFLFSALAGQLADKFEKAWLSQKIKQAECIIMCLAAYFFISESLLGLFGVLFLMGLQSTFFGPIKYSLLPEHLQRDELIAGNGLIELGTFLSILIGTLGRRSPGSEYDWIWGIAQLFGSVFSVWLSRESGDSASARASARLED